MENKNRRSYNEVLACDKSFNNQLQVRIDCLSFNLQLEITKENCDKLEYAGGVQCPRLRLLIGACAQ